jgi:hypothetical protein
MDSVAGAVAGVGVDASSSSTGAAAGFGINSSRSLSSVASVASVGFDTAGMSWFDSSVKSIVSAVVGFGSLVDSPVRSMIRDWTSDGAAGGSWIVGGARIKGAGGGTATLSVDRGTEGGMMTSAVCNGADEGSSAVG